MSKVKETNSYDERTLQSLNKMNENDDSSAVEEERRWSKNKRRTPKIKNENNDVQRTGGLIIERTEIYFYCAFYHLTAMLN